MSSRQQGCLSTPATDRRKVVPTNGAGRAMYLKLLCELDLLYDSRSLFSTFDYKVFLMILIPCGNLVAGEDS
jgi:hypothetical protein